MYVECDRAEINHDFLLSEPEAKARCGYDVADLVVDGLLQVYVGGVNLCDVALDVHQCLYTLLEAYVTPPLLNAESCTFSDDEINWQLLELAAEEMGPELLLNERHACLPVKERLEKA